MGEDDLGLGGHSDSKTTGHAGGRVACCEIKQGIRSGVTKYSNTFRRPIGFVVTLSKLYKFKYISLFASIISKYRQTWHLY